jgi:alpha-1,3-rhamnosyltransferase
MQFPSVSVIVPSFNHAQYLKRTLRSIINQTHKPLELIVIDDGSKDGSAEVAAEVLKDCPFPSELIVRKNRGLTNTLNEGLSRAKGGYFAYLGSDDLWLKEFLERRVNLLESRPEAVLGFGHAYVIDGSDQIIECTKDWARYTDGNAQKMLLSTIAPVSPTVVYRRSALQKERWDESCRLEDYDLYLRLSTLGEFAFDPEVLSAWRLHGTNTSSNLQLMLDECLSSQRKIAPRLNIGRNELKRMEAGLKWKYAADFIRSGDKRQSIKLMLGSLSAPPPAPKIARLLLTLAIPNCLLRWRRRIIQSRATSRYGSLEV